MKKYFLLLIFTLLFAVFSGIGSVNACTKLTIVNDAHFPYEIQYAITTAKSSSYYKGETDSKPAMLFLNEETEITETLTDEEQFHIIIRRELTEEELRDRPAATLGNSKYFVAHYTVPREKSRVTVKEIVEEWMS